MTSRAKSGTFVVLLLLTSSVLAPVLPFGLGEAHAAKAITTPWPMFGQDRLHSALGPEPVRGIMDPFKAWDRGSLTCLGSTVGDFRKNIILENVSTYTRPGLHGVYTRGTYLQVVEGLSGNVMWSVNLGTDVLATTGLTDTDRDGRVEITVATTSGEVSLFEPTIRWNGTAYHYNQTGAMADRIWFKALNEPVLYSSIVLGDITNDGFDDVVIAGQMKAAALNGTSGDWLWNYTLSGPMTGTPAILDWGKTDKRIALASFNISQLKVFVAILNTAGIELKIMNITTSTTIPLQVETILPSISAGDLDGDGAQELVVATPFETRDGRIRAYEMNGDEVWSGPFKADGQIEATPAIGDLDKDGKDDIIALSWNYSMQPLPGDSIGYAYAIDGVTGAKIWNATLNKYPTNITNDGLKASPALIDMNGDKAPDVIVPALNGRIYALNGTDGKTLWQLDTNHPTLISSPALADMDGNGITDIFLDGMLISHRIAQLSISDSDITFSDPNPDEGATVHVSAIVYDTGTRDASNVAVRFEDTYDWKTTVIDDDIIDITAGGTAEAAMDINATGGGDHKITVIVDPDNKIEELNENDNQASKTFKASSHWSLALSSSPSTTVIDPGQQATFTVKVKNTGDRQNVINLVVATTLPQAWAAILTTSQVTVNPSTEQSVGLIVSTSSSSLAGQYAINITGTSQNKSSNHNTTQVIVALRGEYGVLLSADSFEKNVNAEGFARFDINVSNIGNTADTIELYNSSPINSSWLVFVSEQSVDIAARDFRIVSLNVKPPSAAPIGSTEMITVLARSSGDPKLSDDLTFTTHVVAPDLTLQNLTFRRNDGTLADGTKTHLVANRTSIIDVSASNLLGNIDYLQSNYVELLIDGTVSGQAFLDIYGGLPTNTSIKTAFKVGHHTVKVCIDPNGFIQETNENNNCLEAQVTVKSDSSIGPYVVHGTIYWPTGDRVAKADVTVTNLRTNESLSMKADDNGTYSMDLQTLPARYIEEEQVSVKASNGVTVRERTIMAYSEDGGKQVDIVMVPQDYDFYIGPQKKVSTEPGHAAVFSMFVTQLGNATNNITLTFAGLPTAWTYSMTDQVSEPVKTIELVKDQTFNITLKVTPSIDAKANEAGVIMTLTGTSLDQSDKSFAVSVIVGVLQVHKINFTQPGGSVLRGTTGVFNFTVMNEGNGDEAIKPSVVNNTLGWPVRLSTQRLNLTYKASRDMGVEVDVPVNTTPDNYLIGLSLAYGQSQHLDVNLPIEVQDYDYSLEVRNNDLSSRDIKPGDTESFSITVANKGNTDNSVALIVTGGPSGWKVSLEDLYGVPASDADLNKGQSKPFLLKVTAPAQPMGVKNLVINITGISLKDPDKVSTAFALLTVMAPDLTPVGNVTFASKPVEGKTVAVSVQVKNIGTAAATGAVVVFMVDGKKLGQVSMDDLAANTAAKVSIDWKPKAGVHTVMAKINPNQTVAEMNYDNNNIQTTVDVKSSGPSVSLVAGAFLAVLIAAICGIAAYVLWTKRAGAGKLKKRRPRPSEDEEEEEEDDGWPSEDEEEGPPEDEEYPEEDEEVHEAEVVEEEEERPVRKAPMKKAPPKKKVARPMTYAEKYKPDEDDRKVEIDEEDFGGMIRIR